MVVDAAGNVIFTDDFNSLVRSIDSQGILHTIAGTPGQAGFCGDGGPATQACLNRPVSLSLDSLGNLFIADGFNSRVREVSALTRIITTVAGNGTDGFCGDGGPAVAACIDTNAEIQVNNAGNLFIVDNLAERVRMVNSLGIISTVAGSGQTGFCGDGGQAVQACFSGPIGIALSPTQGMFVSDSNNHRVRLVTPNGSISTFAGNGANNICGDGGPALQACLGTPFGIALDDSGNLFLVERNRPATVREIFGSGGGGGGGGGQPPPTGGVLAANNMAGGKNNSNPNSGQTVGCAAQPINTENGSLWHTCTDFSIPGRGVPLNFTRTYNSIFATQDSPVGFGWTCSYCMSLHQDPASGDVTISQENGSQVTFHRSGTTYIASPWVIATLAKNTDGSWTFVREAQITFTFDLSGKLTLEHDLNGYQTSLSYNSAGQLISITDPASRSLNLTYSGSHLTKITDPIGRTMQLNFDTLGNLSNYVDVQGNATGFTYNPSHLMTSMTDPRDGATSNVFDSQNRVSSQTDPMGRVTGLAYSGDSQTGSGGTTTIADPKGNVTQEQYQFGFRVSLTKGFGTAQAATWKFEYDTTALGITKSTDPKGNATKNTFDQSGNLLTTTDPHGRQTNNSYNSFNELVSTKDGNGITTSFNYDPHSNLVSVSRPLVQAAQVQTTSFQYQDPSHPGDVTSKTDPNGNIWKYSYDKFGNQISSTDPLGNKSSATFNKVGFKLSSTAPKGNLPDQDQHHRGDSNHDDNGDMDGSKDKGSFTTTFKYNNYGDLLSSTDQLGHQQSTQYDQNRNVVQSTDGNGNVTKNLFDPDNELIQVNRADGTSVKTTYNQDGTVASQIDGKGAATTYQYDSLARTIASSDPLGRTTRYSFDGAGNLLTKTDAKSQVPSYQYDSANQLIGVSYSDHVTPNVIHLSYDGVGNRLEMTDGTGTSNYSFDSLNRLTSSEDGSGATVGYGYDLNGNLTSLKYPTGNSVTMAFDADSRMASLSDWLGNTEKFFYDPNSNLTQTTFPASTAEVDAQAFDAADNLISIVDAKNNGDGQNHSKQGPENADQGQQSLASFFYTRDGNNQVTSESNQPGQGNSHDDRMHQGDNSGNKSKTYTYTPLNQLKNVNKSSYSYDPADNLVHLINGTTQTFDAANQLVSATKPADRTQQGDQPGHNGGASVTTAFSYDLNGNRVSTTSGNSTTTYTFDQANRLTNFNSQANYSYNGDGLRTSKKVGSTVQPMTWDLSQGLPLLLSDSTNQYVYGPGGLPLEQISTTATADFFHHDQLGSTRLLTDSRGHVDGVFAFDPYGNLSNPSGALPARFLFAGQYLDGESGLYYLRARYYDPTTSQFMSSDPAVAKTHSPYAYVMGNPLNGTDPSGRCGLWGSDTCLGDAAGAVGSALRGAALVSLEVISTGPYLDYYAAYRTDSTLREAGINSPTVQGFLVGVQALNLSVDIGIDQAEQWVGGKRPLNDEGIVDYVLPLSNGPKVYLPGWHQDNPNQIDLSPNSSYPWSAGFGPPASNARTAGIGRNGVC